MSPKVAFCAMWEALAAGGDTSRKRVAKFEVLRHDAICEATLLTSTVWRRMRSYLEARLIGKKPNQPTANKLVR